MRSRPGRHPLSDGNETSWCWSPPRRGTPGRWALCPRGPAAWSGESQPLSGGFEVVGDLDDNPGAIERCNADMVAVASSESLGSEEIGRMAWKLGGSGIAVALVPALTGVAGPRIHIRPSPASADVRLGHEIQRAEARGQNTRGPAQQG